MTSETQTCAHMHAITVQQKRHRISEGSFMRACSEGGNTSHAILKHTHIESTAPSSIRVCFSLCLYEGSLNPGPLRGVRLPHLVYFGEGVRVMIRITFPSSEFMCEQLALYPGDQMWRSALLTTQLACFSTALCTQRVSVHNPVLPHINNFSGLYLRMMCI